MGICIFGAILGIAFAAIVYLSLDFINDNLVNQRLIKEVDYLALQYQGGMNAPESTSPYIKVYLGANKMPAFAKQIVQGLGEGFHEVYYKDVEYHVAVTTLCGRRQNTTGLPVDE